MSKTLKGLIVYTFVIAVIATVVGVLLLGIMFFTANTSKPFKVFGYQVVSQNAKRNDVIADVNGFGAHQSIVINNGGFPLVVELDQTGQNSRVVIQKTDNVFGVVKGDYDPIVRTSVKVEENTLYIDIPSLDGFVMYSNSQVKVILPAIKENKYNLEINSDSGNVLIDGKYSPMVEGEKTVLKNRFLKIMDLTVNTKSANFKILNIGNLEGYDEEIVEDEIEDEEVVEDEIENEEADENEEVDENESGTTNGIKHIPINFQKISLSTNTGRFNFKGIENLKVGEVYQNKVEIKNDEIVEDEVENEDEVEKEEVVENESGTTNGKEHNFVLNKATKTDLVFKNVYSAFEVHANDIRIEAESINTLGDKLNFNSRKGYFKVNKIVLSENGLNENDSDKIVAERTNIKIDEISGGPILIKTTYGNITIGEITDGGDFKTEEGNIHIEKAAGVIEVESRIGKIAVDSYSGSASFKNNKGSIKATFSDDGNADSLTKVKTVKGAVTLNNITEKIKIEATGRSNVTVSFKKLKPGIENEFNLSKGSLRLNLPDGDAFAITFSGQLKDVSGSVAGVNIKNKLEQKTRVRFFTDDESNNENHLIINAGKSKVSFKEIL